MIEKISLTDPVAHAHDRELRKWAMEKALYSMALADLDNTAEATTQITDRAATFLKFISDPFEESAEGPLAIVNERR